MTEILFARKDDVDTLLDGVVRVDLAQSYTLAQKLQGRNNIGLPTLATGQVWLGLTSGDPTALALGTSGYFLGSNGTTVTYQGYTTASTGGVTRTWQAKIGDQVSVKDFGAVGDGSTNDTTAIASAIASGKSLYFPAGTYMTSQIVFNTAFPSGQSYIGAGREQTTFKQIAGSNQDFVVIGADDGTAQNTYLHNLTINGNSVSQTAGSAIKIKGGSAYTHIDTVRVIGGYLHGIHGLAPNYAQNGVEVIITNCQVQDYPFTVTHRLGDGIRLETAAQSTIIHGCDISGGTTNSQTTAGINIINTADVSISDCNIWPETRKVWVQGASYIRISNNNIHSDIETTAVDGVVVENASVVTVHGNVFFNLTGTNVLINGTSTTVAVSGNAFNNTTNTAAYGIREMNTANGNAISGNTFSGTFTTSKIAVVGTTTKVGGNPGVFDVNFSETDGVIAGNTSVTGLLAFPAGNIGTGGAFGANSTVLINIGAGKGLEIAIAGVDKWLMASTAGIYAPTATGTDKGNGTINALGLYINGTAVTAAGITALTGDVTATGPGSVAATLATVNGNVGTFGSATQSVQFTVNGKGLITAAANATVTPAVGSITGLGTNVATALAVNVGSAGAFVVNGGVLGTPSSGTVTNLTGTASININGTVGATTPATGAFTTVVASTSVTTPFIKPASDSTTAHTVRKADGTTNVGVWDTTNSRHGINRTPSYALDVLGTEGSSAPTARFQAPASNNTSVLFPDGNSAGLFGFLGIQDGRAGLYDGNTGVLAVELTPTTDNVTINSTADATSASATAALRSVGGLAVAKKAYIGTDINAVGGNLVFGTAAKGIVLKQGANGSAGTFVANGATPVTVTNSNVAITDSIIISLNTVGGTVGVQPHVATITAATGFTVVCTALDTSTYNYAIVKNAA